MEVRKTYEQLVEENRYLLGQLEEARETIQAIRAGRVDALVVDEADGGSHLYTLEGADQAYRVFIEKMTQGVVTLNADGIILYCNSQFANTVQLPLNKVLGLFFESFISEAYKDAYRETFARGWHEDCNMEIDIANGGKTTPFQLSATTMHLDEGLAMNLILTDLTLHRETEELLLVKNRKLAGLNTALTSSNNDLQQFASVASHDLQEPLRKIQIFATMLRDKHVSDLTGEGATFLEKIITSSQRMKIMIFDILDYSKLAASEENFLLCNLNDIVSEVIEDFEIVINEKRGQVIVDKLPSIEVNRGQIRQVFQNLISNSLKFSKSTVSPVIIIEGGLDEENKCCTIKFTDNGIGFNTAYGDKIFSLFQRLNAQDKYEGSGIGLAITRKIIDKHGGTILASSKEGQGAEFVIKLPTRHYKTAW